jgi:mannose-6-phosphate isomerase-like protein (cupin superfamily)
MSFTTLTKKGIASFFIEAGVDPDKLSLHISQAEPGKSLHAPHTHAGLEAFYMLEGRGAVDTEHGRQEVGPNECVVVDATKPHGLVNVGATVMRYIVIIAK